VRQISEASHRDTGGRQRRALRTGMLTPRNSCNPGGENTADGADKGFWSVTAYGNDDFLIANPLDSACDHQTRLI